jgi:hypothetical protein
LAQVKSASATVAGNRYCSNWDFYNNTGQDVNDLHVRLKGVKAVSEIYTGTLNPFGLPASSGYISATGVYSLNFSGAWVAESEMVHIGFCTDSSLLRLDGQGGAAFQWTLTNTAVPTRPLFTGLEWDWPEPSHFRVRVVNEQPLSMTLVALNLLDADTMLPLEDLVGGVADQLPMALELIDTPVDMAPSADSFFDVFFVAGGAANPPSQAPLLEPNHPYVLEVIMDPTDDPGNTVRLFSQVLSPLIPVYMPVILR